MSPSNSPLSFGLVRLPPGAVIAHYAEIKGRGLCVVSRTGEILGASFYEIRERFSLVCVVNGAGCWFVLKPRQSSLF